MTDIDWLAVDMVCSGIKLAGLTRRENMAIMRRLAPRMRNTSSQYDSGLSAIEVAERLGTTTRTVQRMLVDLPDAQQSRCPVCGEPMWISSGVAEPHPDALFRECPISGRAMVRGLAAARPDLYPWLEVNFA